MRQRAITMMEAMLVTFLLSVMVPTHSGFAPTPIIVSEYVPVKVRLPPKYIEGPVENVPTHVVPAMSREKYPVFVTWLGFSLKYKNVVVPSGPYPDAFATPAPKPDPPVTKSMTTSNRAITPRCVRFVRFHQFGNIRPKRVSSRWTIRFMCPT